MGHKTNVIVALGYSKRTDDTRIGLTIGANRNNPKAVMPNAQAHSTTQKILLASDRLNQTDCMLPGLMGRVLHYWFLKLLPKIPLIAKHATEQLPNFDASTLHLQSSIFSCLTIGRRATEANFSTTLL